MAEFSFRSSHGGKPGAGPSLSVKMELRETAMVVIPTGEIDLTGSPVLRMELRKAQTDRPARLIIDLSGVPYMDSSGVATLVEAMQIARRNNTRLVLCSLRDKVRSIFEIARLDTVFSIAADADAAMVM